ncbi:MAG: hypothetical protein LBR16_07365, partial [Treponema sp.]|nr:hypothetical protein [Treponema sp.]
MTVKSTRLTTTVCKGCAIPAALSFFPALVLFAIAGSWMYHHQERVIAAAAAAALAAQEADAALAAAAPAMQGAAAPGAAPEGEAAPGTAAEAAESSALADEASEAAAALPLGGIDVTTHVPVLARTGKADVRSDLILQCWDNSLFRAHVE